MYSTFFHVLIPEQVAFYFQKGVGRRIFAIEKVARGMNKNKYGDYVKYTSIGPAVCGIFQILRS